jgi:murein DD-endopeptidase MepM/ murein hydrolase activator NlpD
MQRQVLDYLYAQGELVFAVFPGSPAPCEALEKFALALNAGASFVVFDFSQKREGNTGIPLKDLFTRILNNDELQSLEGAKQAGLVFAGFDTLDITEEHFRTFYHNLQLIKKMVPHTVGILPGNDPTALDEKILDIAKIVLVGGNSTDEAAAFIEDCAPLRKKNILWLLEKMPEKKRFPKCVKAIRKGSTRDIRKKVKGGIEGAGEALAECVQWILKEEILKKNPMEGLSRLFRNLFPLFLLVALLVPFIYPTSIETTHSNMRDRIPERNKLSVAPSFDYTFDGKENLRRIARYAIGRFNAVISDDKMIRQYLEETISENGYKGQGWESNALAVPPQGTVIKFSRPDNLGKTAADSIGAAWKYWTSILSDSIAYITEFYNERGIGGRKHNGIDLASRKGARILAPFSAKAYTSRDERGGVVIGLVREKDVILFMHCDQLLYLDGQEVMQGDPIATVGMTGHTTGPHAHVVTGVIDRRGNNRIGNVKYKVIDPIAWYYKFKPNTP